MERYVLLILSLATGACLASEVEMPMDPLDSSATFPLGVIGPTLPDGFDDLPDGFAGLAVHVPRGPNVPEAHSSVGPSAGGPATISSRAVDNIGDAILAVSVSPAPSRYVRQHEPGITAVDNSWMTPIRSQPTRDLEPQLGSDVREIGYAVPQLGGESSLHAISQSKPDSASHWHQVTPGAEERSSFPPQQFSALSQGVAALAAAVLGFSLLLWVRQGKE